jgi:hypothetical protein
MAPPSWKKVLRKLRTGEAHGQPDSDASGDFSEEKLCKIRRTGANLLILRE